MTHPAVAGQTFLVSDGEDVSTADLLRMLGEPMERHARLFSFSMPLLKLAGGLVGKNAEIERLVGSLQIDSDKIRRDLGWVSPYTLQDWLRKTGEAFKAGKNRN